jgi:hypothetical protein
VLKKRRRIRRSNSKNRKLYFDENTQNAIVDFQNAECLKEKEKIYEEKI